MITDRDSMERELVIVNEKAEELMNKYLKIATEAINDVHPATEAEILKEALTMACRGEVVSRRLHGKAREMAL